jgi:hypothetical protein
MKNQGFQESHRMVPKKMFTEGVDEETRKLGRIEFRKCLAALGLDSNRIKECFTILSTCESQNFEMMKQIPGGFEKWATIGMFMRDKPRVDQMYLRMSLRDSSARVWSLLEHECFMDRSQQMIRRLKRENEEPQLTTNTPSVYLSPVMLTNKALKRARKNLLDAFLVGYYNSEQSSTSPSMNMVISHWRGILEAYRVTLRLDGKHDYPQEIFYGDMFLKLLLQELPTKKTNH